MAEESRDPEQAEVMTKTWQRPDKLIIALRPDHVTYRGAVSVTYGG